LGFYSVIEELLDLSGDVRSVSAVPSFLLVVGEASEPMGLGEFVAFSDSGGEGVVTRRERGSFFLV
jgi:hypothetical protein